MPRIQRLAKDEQGARGQSAGPRASKGRSKRSTAQNRRSRVKRSPTPGSGRQNPLQNMRFADLYRPLKKPVTIRIDADVLAWFKKDGKRYQTRINKALRKVMDQEMKEV